ncbi:hypothetical protein, partial [uncultured Allobaculum sp.]|uniref:hypothetical protein n=1 Tax=uncultured Allobaculum sp. TaxID=1187017 RepID=UPI00259921F6
MAAFSYRNRASALTSHSEIHFSLFTGCLYSHSFTPHLESGLSEQKPARTMIFSTFQSKRQIKDGYFLDRLLGIIPLFKEAFS